MITEKLQKILAKDLSIQGPVGYNKISKENLARKVNLRRRYP